MSSSLNGVVKSGNCFELMKLMPDQSFDLILTDPPYAINYRSNRRVVKPKFDHLEGDKPGAWIDEFAHQAYRLLRDNTHLYCFCRYDTYPDFFTAFDNAGFKMKRTLIWIKNNHGAGDLKGDYAPRDEWIIFAHKGRRLLQGKREQNVFENTFHEDKIHSDGLKHPTQKPVALLKKLILNSTNSGEVIFDPFAGVLSTAIAAVETKRSFICIEIEDHYLELGIGRLLELTSIDKYQTEFPAISK
ncbi:DNA-methyltransferase [Calditrichota bacterium]